MKHKVQQMTDTWMELSGGNEGEAAAVMSNFQSQRTVQPFVYSGNKTAVERYGINCLSTMHSCKKACGAGAKGATNVFRRQLVAASAHGPMSTEEVGAYLQ